jgi:hypothetical protein
VPGECPKETWLRSRAEWKVNLGDRRNGRRRCTLSLATLHQLLGYLLLDYDDAYQIDALGVSTCASRSHGVRGAQRSPGDWLYLTNRAVGGRQPAHRALDPNRGRRGDSSGPRDEDPGAALTVA